MELLVKLDAPEGAELTASMLGVEEENNKKRQALLTEQFQAHVALKQMTFLI